MQINDGTEPRQDFSDFLNEVITDHDCKLGDNDLEQFDKDALEFFIMFINKGIETLKYITVEHIEDLQALRIMMYNAKNKKLKS